jgi:hypothetical protein
MTDHHNFNTDIILNEIDLVIKKGLNQILKDYMTRYSMLEKTHKQIMNLPSVLHELNKNTDEESCDVQQKCEDIPMFVSITDMTKELIRENMVNVESKMTELDKKYDLIFTILNKIFMRIDDLNEDVKCIKKQPNEVKVIKYNDSNYEKNIDKKENIKLEINEDTIIILLALIVLASNVLVVLL